MILIIFTVNSRRFAVWTPVLSVGIIFELAGFFVFEQVFDVNVEVIDLILAGVHGFTYFVLTTGDVMLPFAE